MFLLKKLVIAVATAAIAGIGTAKAAKATNITLTFEGLSDKQHIGNYYAAEGITFSDNALALISDQAGGTGSFDRNSLPSGDTVLFFKNGAVATLNDINGFTNSLSFYYAAINQPSSIKIYSGLNATGTLLTTLDLPATPSNSGTRFQTFVPIGVSFNGVAKSIDFGGAVNQVGYDNITLDNVSTPVPEPSYFPAFLVLGANGFIYWLRQKLR